MPIVGWIFIVDVVALVVSIIFGEACDHIGFGCIIGGFICVIITLVMIWYFNNTANGIERIVKVYDVNGQLIAQYDGKFDVTCDGDRILFSDKNGKKHIVHYPTGAVVIDEK